MSYKRTSLGIGIMPLKNKENKYEATPYIVEKFSEEAEDDDISFGKKESKSLCVVRDKNQNVMIPSVNPEFCAALLSGLDRLHATEEAKAIDEILEGVSDAKKDVARTSISGRDLFTRHELETGFSEAVLAFTHEDLSTIDKPAIKPDKIYKETDEVTSSINKEIATQMKIFGSSGNTSTAVGVEMLDKYAFKKPVLLLGEAGSGKTRMLSQWILDKGKEEEIAYIHADGHEGFEVSDMLGMMVPNEAGGLSWIDGPVTQAFRSANKGHKTVLFMDEILRIPSRERSLLIGSLIPKADGLLSMRTNRIAGYDKDGVGITEEIKCHPSFLWVVAASNIGTGFDIEDMDSAFQDRFRAFRVDSTVELIKLIAVSICREKKFPDVLAVKMIELFTTFADIKKKGSLQKTFSARHISEVLSIAEEASDVGLLLEDLTYTILSINGSGLVNEAEKEIWDSLIQDFM